VVLLHRGLAMNRILITLLRSLILFIGLSITHEAKSIDTQVMPYYVKFMSIADQCYVKVNDVHLRIEMTKELKPAYWVAVCDYENNLIQVNRKIWDRLTKERKEQTILHELGHCLLNKRHDDTYINIMNASGFIDKDKYIKYYDFYIRRLFNNCRKPRTEEFKYEEVK
jgi:hypothetical protein